MDVEEFEKEGGCSALYKGTHNGHAIQWSPSAITSVLRQGPVLVMIWKLAGEEPFTGLNDAPGGEYNGITRFWHDQQQILFKDGAVENLYTIKMAMMKVAEEAVARFNCVN